MNSTSRFFGFYVIFTSCYAKVAGFVTRNYGSDAKLGETIVLKYYEKPNIGSCLFNYKTVLEIGP